MAVRRITVSIDRLVLRGVDVADRARFERAVRAGIARALADHGVATGLAAGAGAQPHRARVDAGRVAWPETASSTRLGHSTARAIVEALGR